MIKGAIKRMGSMLLALLLVLSMVPLSAMPVSAAEISGLADLEIGLRNSGDGIWNATGTTIIGSVTGSGSTCSSSSEDTLTITNQKDTSATLSFDYKFELNDGSVVIDGVSYTNAGTFSKDLNPNESISIQLTSAEGENTTTITIENIFLYGSGTYKVVFSPAEGGSYTVDGEAVPETRLEKENESSHAYALVATAASNYKFLGWKDENNTVLSTDASTTIHIDENTTVTPWFVPEDTAVFSVDGSYYTDLNEAVEKAQESATKLVSVAMDGKLQEGTYTISSGVTLLVPFDEVNTVYTDEPANTGSAYSKPSRFRLLTMEPGAHITVSDGASISVGSKHTGVVDGGTGATGSGSYKQGVAVTINAGTKTGCVFEKWTADSADVIFTNAEATKTTFTMPDHNVTITAIWHCHKDNATKNEGKAATCTEAGTREYYTCTCGMNFEDADCTKEIQDDIDTWKIIPELGHSYGPPTFKWSQDYKSCIVVFDCTRDGCSSRQELEATVDSRTDTPASCEQMGSTAYTASVTFQEKEYQDTKTVQDIPATGHNWKPQYNWSEDLQSCSVTFTCQNDSSHTHTQNAEVTSEITTPATCTAMGTTAYTAAVTFEGKAYENVQTKADIPMIPHAYSDAWQYNGEKHWKECTACKTPAEEGAHTFQWIVDKPATEDETGLKHEECTMCHYERNEDTPIDKLDHIHTGITHHAAVPSTCSVQGTVEYWTCSSEKCQGKYYGDEDCQVILTSIEAELDPNNHVGETERRNAIEATCTHSGYTGDLYCLACDSLISKGESIPVKDHTYRNEWSMDAENHWKVCSICEAPGEKVEHIFTNDGDLICNECGYQRKPVLATELAISAEPDTLTGGGNVILKVTGVPEGQAVKVTCDDSEIIVTQTESVWTASLPNISKEYTFTATSSADGETTGTAACKIEVTAYSGGGGGTPSTPSEPEEPTWPFEDVTEGDDWFYDAVAYVYENGIMAGTGETTFEPTMELNRAQAAQLFYNLEGQPAVTGDTDFTDVTSGHWAVEAITWAAQNNVVAGIGEGLYDPDSNVTREQFAQMLYNYAKYKGYDLTASGDLTQFPDAGSISSWAETALSWANGKGLINGHEDGTIDHQGSTIRAQAASIMANFDQNVVK